MALTAAVKDGQIVESASQSSLNKANAKSTDGMDKDAFLQLLVAQMKYQDPLEPTSNTEYISQYAQFSQVEQMQNMAGSMDLQRASSLVGQEVYIKTTGSDGTPKYIQGKVDYVVYENGEAFLAIDEELYSIDDLDTVADKEYLAAYDKATDFVTRIKKLPGLLSVGEQDIEEIEALQTAYQEMTEYEKRFIASDVVSDLSKYVEQKDLVKNRLEQNQPTEETTDETGGE